MATTRSAWGIDIGNRALKAVKLVRDGDRLRVDDLEVIEHEQILSSAGDNKEGLIQSALANFVQRHATKGSVVGIGVSGQSSFARFIKLPPVETKKIPEIVKFEAIQQIPFPLEDVEWSYQLFQDPQSPDIEVGIFAMRKEIVNAYIKQFTDLEMNVQVVQMGPLAVYNGMAYEQRLASGTTMIVDCGAENTDLIISDGETVWLRTISIGGNNFTEALTKSFKLNFPKAEELKRNAATSKYQRQIFQAMRPVFADLVSEVQRSIGFYGTVHRESRIKKIIALGSTFRLPTLQKYLQQNLQVEVEKVDGFSGGSPSDGKLGALLTENLVSMGTAYGLAVQAMGEAKITSSLLPEPIRKAKLWKEKVPWFGLAAACFVVGTAGVAGRYFMDDKAFSDKTETRTKVDQVVANAKSADSAWSQTQEKGAPDRKRIQDVQDMLSHHVLWAQILSDIGNAMPPQPKTAAEAKAKPRHDREQIILNSITSQYASNMTNIVSMKENDFKNLMGGTGATATPTLTPATDPSAAAAPASGTPPRGFLITIKCTTPNQKGSTFVTDNFLQKLSALNAESAFKAHKPFYVAKAAVVSELFVKNDSNIAAASGAPVYGGAQGRGELGGGAFPNNNMMRNNANGGYPGRGNYGGVNRGFNRREAGFRAPGAFNQRPAVPLPTTGPAATQELAPQVPYPDPQTGEDMGDDKSLTVLVAIVLDPPQPAAKEEGTATGSPQAAAH